MNSFDLYVLSERGRIVARVFGSYLATAVAYCANNGVDGREIALVKTKLEEAFLIGVRALASRELNHDEVV
jgi:hypothetical protein